jgi:acetyl-CoA carboxylase carboxyl transferase subunit alpha
MFRYSYYSVCSPEACASILWRSATEAKNASEALRLTAKDLTELGLIDGILPEPAGGAHTNPQAMAQTLKQSIVENLKQLKRIPTDDLVKQRYAKFRKMGQVLDMPVEGSLEI